MATGTPKKDKNIINNTVRLTYKDKASKEEILNHTPPVFAAYPSASSFKRLYFSDNLDALRALLNDQKLYGRINLIYIDPPFATQSQFHSRSQTQAYDDTLSGAAFVEFLRKRIILLHELLSNEGSIYLHLDEKMIFQMKIIMDEVFGIDNYRNMIVRKKCNPKNYTRKSYGNIADFILFYTKTNKYVWNRQTMPLSEDAKREYHYIEQGTGRRYMKVPVHAPGTRNGETGKPWRGLTPPPGKHWQYTPEQLDAMDARGEIFWSKNGNPRRKVYLDEHPGVGIQDIWLDFRDAHNQNIKITGYPTEKNPDLLKRIIAASSNPGDIVLDCFAGSGTTLAVADEMQRNWIGIDNSAEAIKTILRRFEYGLQAMGDFVKKKESEELLQMKQQTLFESLDTDINQTPVISSSAHRPISDFSLFILQESPAEAREIVNDLLFRKRTSDSCLSTDASGISETSYSKITYYLHNRDKHLAKIINYIGPCTLASRRAGFDFLVDAIVSQQLSKSAADSILNRLRVACHGEMTPATFVNLARNEVRSLGISDRKYEYIFDLCKQINDNSLQLSQLNTIDEDTIRKELKKVHGIGDWTVDMYLLFGLGRLDIFPANDLALRKIISNIYLIPDNDTQSIMAIAERWKPYRSVGSWYLYRYGNQTTSR